MSKKFGGILNPQEKIPDVQSKYTIVKDQIHPIDLNEDSWSMDYFVIFFHTGPRDPVATELLHLLDKQNNPGVSEFPCKIVAISMDSPQAIYDWVQEFPDFDVPMMSDKENAIGEQFGVMMDWSPGLDHPGPGYCANAAFIVDKFDKVRYHSVLDARCVHDLDELARVVNALKATDNGKLAMVDWKDDSYSIENSKEAISEWQREYDESYKARHTTMMAKMRGWWGRESSGQGEAYPKQAQVSVADEALNYLTLENENQNWQYSFGRLCISEDATDTLIDGEGVYHSEDEADIVTEEEYTEHWEQDADQEDAVTDEEYYDEAPAGGGARYRVGAARDTPHYGEAAGHSGQRAEDEDEEIGKRRARARMEKKNPSQYRNPHPAGNPSQRNQTPARNPSKYRNQTPSRHPSQYRNPNPGRHPSQKRRSPSPSRNLSPYRRSPTPARRSQPPFQERRNPSPGRKSPYPGSRSAPPTRRSPTQYRRSPSPARVPSHYRRSPPPSRRTPTRSPVHYRNPPPARQPSQYRNPYATRTPSNYQGRKPQKMQSSRSKRRW